MLAQRLSQRGGKSDVALLPALVERLFGAILR